MKIKLHRSGHVTLVDDSEGEDRTASYCLPPCRSARILSMVGKEDRQRVAQHLLNHSLHLLPAHWDMGSLKVDGNLRVSGRYDPDHTNFHPGRYDFGGVVDVLSDAWYR